MKNVVTIHFAYWRMPLLLLGFLVLPIVVLAGGKDYPLQGIVTSLGTSQETTGGGNTSVVTHVHRTYTVKTSTRIFVLECPYWMDGFHIHWPSECGGKKKIEIGDAIKFRVEKQYAGVLTGEGKEQKLRVVSEGMNDPTTVAPETSQHP